MNYQHYLQSETWKRKKQEYYERIGRDRYQCAICGIKSGLQLHHKTYDRLGNESMSDLVYLCRQHHNHLHKTGGLDGAENTWLQKKPLKKVTQQSHVNQLERLYKKAMKSRDFEPVVEYYNTHKQELESKTGPGIKRQITLMHTKAVSQLAKRSKQYGNPYPNRTDRTSGKRLRRCHVTKTSPAAR